MRKREVEKLLYQAVAEALGVESRPVRKVGTPPAAAAARKPSPHRPDHRAAA